MTFVDSQGKRVSAVSELHGKPNGGSFTPSFKMNTLGAKICRTHYSSLAGTTKSLYSNLNWQLQKFMKRTLHNYALPK